MYNYHAQSGFSIMETMIASFVLIVGIVAVLELFAPIIINSGQTRDRIVATALSQEGVELVKNLRDNNMVKSGVDAFTGLGTAVRCIDKDSINMESCSSDGRLSILGQWMVHSGSIGTNFKRKIRLNQSGDNLIITSYTIWGDGSFPGASMDNPNTCILKNKCVFTRTELTKWK